MTSASDQRPLRPGATTCAPAAHAVVALVVFVIALEAHRIVAAIPGYVETVGGWPDPVRWLLSPVRWLVLILVGLAVVGVSPRRAPRELGLAVAPRSALLALGFALVCSGPMLVLGLAGTGGRFDLEPLLIRAAVIAPLAEETLFRGYAFGQLVRRAGWGVWPAALVTGLIFGVVHLFNAEVQAHQLPGQVLSIGLIAAGGIAYAWLFHRWRLNLWIAVGLHAFMNLWYALFDMGTTPIGSAWLIASRVAVVAIAITATELWLRRRAVRA